MRYTIILLLVTMLLCVVSVAQNFGYENNRLFKDARTGDPEAQYTLAHLYLKGAGGIEKDSEKGVMWLRRAAEAGHIDGMYHLAMSLLDDKGDRRSRTEALVWLRRASDHGHPEAQYTLGRAYGLRTQQGVYLLEQSERAGLRLAVEYLGRWCTEVVEACR